MKAVRFSEYGGPEVLQVVEVEAPHAGPGRVRIAVRAAGVNPIDWKIRSGAMRLISGRRFPKRVGSDFAGEVVELGDKATGVMVGDHVWGVLTDLSGRTGAASEYILAEPQAISPAPSIVASSASVTNALGDSPR